ncbi:hypothetical protein ACSSS7_004066 [Eimeria intestinalis]
MALPAAVSLPLMRDVAGLFQPASCPSISSILISFSAQQRQQQQQQKEEQQQQRHQQQQGSSAKAAHGDMDLSPGAAAAAAPASASCCCVWADEGLRAGRPRGGAPGDSEGKDSAGNAVCGVRTAQAAAGRCCWPQHQQQQRHHPSSGSSSTGREEEVPPSNGAVDEVAERVLEQGLVNACGGSLYRPNCLRIGRP